MVNIYVPAAGDLATEALNALATLVSTDTFHSALKIAITLAIIMTGYVYSQQKANKLGVLTKGFLRYFVVLYLLLGLKVTVHVQDMQNPMSAANVVDNVPAGVAIPGAIVSELGRAVAQLFDDIFHMPDDLEYNQTGLLFGSRVLLNSNDVDLEDSPAVRNDVLQYVRQCVLASQLLASRKLSPKTLMASSDLSTLLFTNPSPLFRVILHDGQNLTCKQAAPIVKKALQQASPLMVKSLAERLTNGDTTKYNNVLEASYQHLTNLSRTGPEILMQNYLANTVRDAARDTFGFTGNVADMMNFNYTAAQHKKRIAEANLFMMAAYNLPLLMSVLWILCLCLFPIIILLAFMPAYDKVYVTYIKSLVYLWTWPPMFSILHFFMSFYTAHKVGAVATAAGGLTLSNMHGVASVQTDIALTAGFIASAIPFIAVGLTRGLANAFSAAAQYMGGMDHGLAQSEAASSAMGNLSMGNFSAWNMNYDNLSAHKHDTNYTDYRGLSTTQLANGGLLTQTMGGQTVVSSQPSMSQLATNLHAGERVASSLTKSASEAAHQAKSLRASAEHHLSEGLNQLASFGQNDGQDYRSGAGLSNSQQDSYATDLRHMQDSVKQYNEHHDKSHQVTVDEAARLNFSSGSMAAGQALQEFTGLSASASAGVSHSNTHSGHYQEFLNSSEGKHFSQSFNHMVSTAKSDHLDASTSHNLSQSQQIAANLSTGMSLSHQASTELGVSEQYQSAASSARDASHSIDQNLSQPFTDWAISQHGDAARSTLAGTDAKSLATQQQWANDFFNSHAGQSAIEHQANSLMKQSTNNMQANFQQSSAAIGANAPVRQQFAGANQQVSQQAQAQQFKGMNQQQIKEAKQLIKQHAHADLMRTQNILMSDVVDHQVRGQSDINSNQAARKKAYE